jgi:hypothetical protein
MEFDRLKENNKLNEDEYSEEEQEDSLFMEEKEFVKSVLNFKN